MLPVMLICICIFAVIFKYKLRAIEKSETRQQEEFFQREQKASLPIKRSMNDLQFTTIPLDKLPFLNNPPEELAAYQDKMKSLSQKKLCNLSGISNTDLKLKYGAGNLEELSSYDQNYALFLRTLADWGACLYEHQYPKEAQKVLEYAKDCKSDIRKNYATLARIYKDEKQFNKIYELLSFVETIPSTLDLKKPIYQVLNDYKD